MTQKKLFLFQYLGLQTEVLPQKIYILFFGHMLHQIRKIRAFLGVFVSGEFVLFVFDRLFLF